MTVELLNPILQAVIALGMLAAYAALRAAGTDEPVLLGLLAGQLGGHGVTHLAGQVKAAVRDRPSPAAPAGRPVSPPTPPPLAPPSS